VTFDEGTLISIVPANPANWANLNKDWIVMSVEPQETTVKITAVNYDPSIYDKSFPMLRDENYVAPEFRPVLPVFPARPPELPANDAAEHFVDAWPGQYVWFHPNWGNLTESNGAGLTVNYHEIRPTLYWNGVPINVASKIGWDVTRFDAPDGFTYIRGRFIAGSQYLGMGPSLEQATGWFSSVYSIRREPTPVGGTPLPPVTAYEPPLSHVGQNLTWSFLWLTSIAGTKRYWFQTNGNQEVVWDDVTVRNQAGSDREFVGADGWTYHRGANREIGFAGDGSLIERFEVRRQRTV
jgi:hypothetical protein